MNTTTETTMRKNKESRLWLYYAVAMAIILSVVYLVSQASNVPMMG